MITGGCLCGSVRYEAQSQPLFGIRCYCRDCQRASGSSHVPIMVFKSHLLKRRGETRTFAVVGDSGRRAIRHFCPLCGSLLFGAPEAAPHILTVYAGTLDDPKLFKSDYSQFVRSRPSWDTQHDDLEFVAGAPRTDPER